MKQINFSTWMKSVNMTGGRLVEAFEKEGVKIWPQTISAWKSGVSPKRKRNIEALEKISGKKIEEFLFE